VYASEVGGRDGSSDLSTCDDHRPSQAWVPSMQRAAGSTSTPNLSKSTRLYEHAGLILSVARRQDGSTRLELTRSSTSQDGIKWLFAIFAALLAMIHGAQAQRVDPRWLAALPLGLLAAFMLWPGPVSRESILVIRDLGLQCSTERSNPLLCALGRPVKLAHLGLRRQTRFIPRDEIMDVVVHEGFRRWSVLSFVAVLTLGGGSTTASVSSGRDAIALQPGGEGGVTVLFPHLTPRLNLVQIAYTEIHRVLF